MEQSNGNKKSRFLAIIGMGLVAVIVYIMVPRLLAWQAQLKQPKTQEQNKFIKQEPETKIKTELVLNEYADTEGGSPNSAIDGSLYSWWYIPTNADKASEVVLELAASISIAELDFVFAPDRYAKAFSVLLKSDDQWVTAADVLGNQQTEQVKLTIDSAKAIPTNAVKIIFLETSGSDNLISLREVKVYQKL